MSRRVYAARAGRITGGIVASFFALVFAVYIAFLNVDRWVDLGRLFLSAWPIGLSIGTVVFLVMFFVPLGSKDNLFEVAGRAYAMEVKSIAWPLTALALLVPLTVQYLVLDAYDVENHFGYWTRHWLLTAGPSHAALIYFSHRIARGVPSFPRFATKAWVVITVSGAPGALLFAYLAKLQLDSILVPAVYMSICGTFALGFMPLWYFARAIVYSEREDIARMTASFDSPAKLKALIRDDAVDENARILAMYSLARSSGQIHLLAVLDEALLSDSPAMSAAALDLAQHLRHRPGVEGMKRALRHESRRTALVACEVAKHLREPALERALVGVLAGATPKADSGVAIAAIDALGACGTPAAIEVLWQVERLRWINRSVKEAAEMAIERIQSRAQLDGDGGELSLATAPASGAISFANGDSGALSDPKA